MKLALALIVITLLAIPCTAAEQTETIMPTYKPVTGISGSIKAIGSDTMNNLMALWGEGFRRFYPDVKIEIEGKGSSTAPPALMQGTAQFGPMSREMKQEEVDAFEKTRGYKPMKIEVAIDLLAIYVNKDNPIEGLALAEVDAIFSRTRYGGYGKDITTWGDAGLAGSWEKMPISLYGRNSASGTYGFLKEHALFKGDFKDEVKEQPGSSSVVQAVATDLYGIGYSGIGYKTADVRAVPLSQGDDRTYYEAVSENAFDGSYPLARFLYIYVDKPPLEELDPLRLEFLKFVLSKEGQEMVRKEGYLPLPAGLLLEKRQTLGIEN